jgi:hypothetical protein
MNLHVKFHVSLLIGAFLISLHIEGGCGFTFQGCRVTGRCHYRGPVTTFYHASSPSNCEASVRGRPLSRLMVGEEAAIAVDAEINFEDMEAKTTEVIVSDATDTKSINVEMLKKESFVRDARQLIESMEHGLAKGGIDVFPPELEALKGAVDDSSSTAALLSQRIYELLIEKGMQYDLDRATGRLTPTEFNIQENLDVPAVKNEFFRQYSFGMQAAMTGVLDVEKVKEIVLERLIKRTGLSPEEFDRWLGF